MESLINQLNRMFSNELQELSKANPCTIRGEKKRKINSWVMKNMNQLLKATSTSCIRSDKENPNQTRRENNLYREISPP